MFALNNLATFYWMILVSREQMMNKCRNVFSRCLKTRFCKGVYGHQMAPVCLVLTNKLFMLVLHMIISIPQC